MKFAIQILTLGGEEIPGVSSMEYEKSGRGDTVVAASVNAVTNFYSKRPSDLVSISDFSETGCIARTVATMSIFTLIPSRESDVVVDENGEPIAVEKKKRGRPAKVVEPE